MDKKTQGIIATVVTSLLCGLPGLCMLCFDPVSMIVGAIPESEIDIFGRSEPGAAIGFGIATLCVGVIFIAIPIVVGLLMLREKPEDVIEGEEVVEEEIPGDDL